MTTEQESEFSTLPEDPATEASDGSGSAGQSGRALRRSVRIKEHIEEVLPVEVPKNPREERVVLWHTIRRCKVAGFVAPKRKNLVKFLKKHPHLVEYDPAVHDNLPPLDDASLVTLPHSPQSVGSQEHASVTSQCQSPTDDFEASRTAQVRIIQTLPSIQALQALQALKAQGAVVTGKADLDSLLSESGNCHMQLTFTPIKRGRGRPKGSTKKPPVSIAMSSPAPVYDTFTSSPPGPTDMYASFMTSPVSQGGYPVAPYASFSPPQGTYQMNDASQPKMMPALSPLSSALFGTSPDSPHIASSPGLSAFSLGAMTTPSPPFIPHPVLQIHSFSGHPPVAGGGVVDSKESSRSYAHSMCPVPFVPDSQINPAVKLDPAHETMSTTSNYQTRGSGSRSRAKQQTCHLDSTTHSNLTKDSTEESYPQTTSTGDEMPEISDEVSFNRFSSSEPLRLRSLRSYTGAPWGEEAGDVHLSSQVWLYPESQTGQSRTEYDSNAGCVVSAACRSIPCDVEGDLVDDTDSDLGDHSSVIADDDLEGELTLEATAVAIHKEPTEYNDDLRVDGSTLTSAPAPTDLSNFVTADDVFTDERHCISVASSSSDSENVPSPCLTPQPSRFRLRSSSCKSPPALALATSVTPPSPPNLDADSSLPTITEPKAVFSSSDSMTTDGQVDVSREMNPMKGSEIAEIQNAGPPVLVALPNCFTSCVEQPAHSQQHLVSSEPSKPPLGIPRMRNSSSSPCSLDVGGPKKKVRLTPAELRGKHENDGSVPALFALTSKPEKPPQSAQRHFMPGAVVPPQTNPGHVRLQHSSHPHPITSASYPFYPSTTPNCPPNPPFPVSQLHSYACNALLHVLALRNLQSQDPRINQLLNYGHNGTFPPLLGESEALLVNLFAPWALRQPQANHCHQPPLSQGSMLPQSWQFHSTHQHQPSNEFPNLCSAQHCTHSCCGPRECSCQLHGTCPQTRPLYQPPYPLHARASMGHVPYAQPTFKQRRRHHKPPQDDMSAPAMPHPNNDTEPFRSGSSQPHATGAKKLQKRKRCKQVDAMDLSPTPPETPLHVPPIQTAFSSVPQLLSKNESTTACTMPAIPAGDASHESGHSTNNDNQLDEQHPHRIIQSLSDRQPSHPSTEHPSTARSFNCPNLFTTDTLCSASSFTLHVGSPPQLPERGKLNQDAPAPGSALALAMALVDSHHSSSSPQSSHDGETASNSIVADSPSDLAVALSHGPKATGPMSSICSTPYSRDTLSELGLDTGTVPPNHQHSGGSCNPIYPLSLARLDSYSDNW